MSLLRKQDSITSKVLRKRFLDCSGYAHFRNGRLHGFDTTKRGLLIGYDMMPLLGLDRMERRLKKRGTIERVRLVADRAATEWGAMKDGVPIISFAGWQGGLSDTKKRAQKSLAGFLTDQFEWGSKELLALYHLWMPPFRKNSCKTIIRPKLVKQALGIIRGLGYDVVRMRFERTTS